MNSIRDAVFQIKDGKSRVAAATLRGVFNRSRDVQKKSVLLTVIMSLEGSGEVFTDKVMLEALRPYCDQRFNPF